MTSTYDRRAELKAFDDSKTGVKGLVDTGITKIPRMFIQPQDSSTIAPKIKFNFPIIDLDYQNLSTDPKFRRKIIEEVRKALEDWGFFEVINHGINPIVLEDMLKGVKRFYGQDDEVKKGWYTRDLSRRFVYNSNFDLYTAPAANWRDTSPEELPPVCSVYTCKRSPMFTTRAPGNGGT